MKQASDTRTPDLPGIETGNGGGRLPDAPATRRGAYRGAVKLGCQGHALRARTGLSQAEFAQRAGVSERSLRAWESSDLPQRDAPRVHAAIVACLARLGVRYELGRDGRRAAMAAAADAFTSRAPMRYRNALTGDTWSGRGLMPRWLRHELDKGARLVDFEL